MRMTEIKSENFRPYQTKRIQHFELLTQRKYHHSVPNSQKLPPEICSKSALQLCILESVQDFLIKLDMKPCMHLVEISTFSLNLVIARATKIMNRADKNWTQFQKIKYLKNQKFQKHFLIKVGLLVEYSPQNFFLGIFNQFFTQKMTLKVRILRCSRRLFIDNDDMIQ